MERCREPTERKTKVIPFTSLAFSHLSSLRRDKKIKELSLHDMERCREPTERANGDMVVSERKKSSTPSVLRTSPPEREREKLKKHLSP
jgi:hypothetical protein